MPFRHPIVRGLIAAIIILAILPLNAAYAQEGTEGTPTEASGTLLVTAALCSEGGEPGTVLFALDSGIASGATCAPADIAISIDGAEAVGVSGSGVFSLPEGTHTVTDIETGQSLAVDIFADTQTAIERVAFAAVQIAEVPTDTPVPTETATATPPVGSDPRADHDHHASLPINDRKPGWVRRTRRIRPANSRLPVDPAAGQQPGSRHDRWERGIVRSEYGHWRGGYRRKPDTGEQHLHPRIAL